MLVMPGKCLKFQRAAQGLGINPKRYDRGLSGFVSARSLT
jgi:hypothetical protein